MPERACRNACGHAACGTGWTGKRSDPRRRCIHEVPEELRARLDVLDRELLQLVAERQSISTGIAVKRATGQPRDFAASAKALKARRDADALGVHRRSRSMLQLLIRSSLTTQEQARVAAQGRGSGRRARDRRCRQDGTLTSFLASQGFAVTIADPGEPVPNRLRCGLDADRRGARPDCRRDAAELPTRY